MENLLKAEFKWKHFAFHGCPPDRFYTSQWTDKKWILFFIKLLMTAYWLGWFIAALTHPAYKNKTEWWAYLTNWGVISILLYLIASCATVTYGIIKPDPIPPTTPRLNSVSDPVSVQATDVAMDSKLCWLHIAVWILHSVALNTAIEITVLFWTLLGPDYSAFGINNHTINSVIMIIDLFLIDIPVRLLHFYHTSLFSVVYTIFLLILHGVGYTSMLYSIVNWATNPGRSAGICVGLIFIVAPIVHAVSYALYHLRFFIARKTVLKPKPKVVVKHSSLIANPT